MQPRASLTVFLLLICVLSGCVKAGSSNVNAANAPLAPAGPAVFTDGTGGIEGVVTDDELVPVAGAIVGLVRSDVITTDFTVRTDPFGAFSLSNVPPGVHAIQASFLGYTPQNKYVGVFAGSAATVSLVLVRIPDLAAYGTTVVSKGVQSAVGWRATPECLFFTDLVAPDNPARNLMKTCGGYRLGCTPEPDPCERHFINEFLPGSKWRSIIAELTWASQSGATGQGFQLDLNAPNITRNQGGSIDQSDSHTFESDAVTSPNIIRVDLPTSLEAREIPESDWYSYPQGRGCTAPDFNNNGNCDWFYRLFSTDCDVSATAADDCTTSPVDVSLQYEMAFTMYFSYFYIDPAPMDWSALPDA